MTDDLHDLKLEFHRTFNAMLDKLDSLEEKSEDAEALIPQETSEELVETHDDHDHADRKEFYIAPDSNETGLLKGIRDAIKGGVEQGITIMKGVDGHRYMLIGTSNAYKDREGETITTEALKMDVDRHWTEGDTDFMSNNPLLFWHDDRLNIGDIVWGDVRGPMYVELAREGDTPLAHKMWDALEASDDPLGASHRFAYFEKDRNEDGDYKRIFKQETTILPREAAANLLTFSEVLPVSEKRNDYLAKLTGLDNPGELLDESVDALVQAWNAQGLEHKATDDEAQPEPGLSAEVAKGFIDLVTDVASLDERVSEVVNDLSEKAKAYDDSQTELQDALKAANELAERLQERLDAAPTRASRAKETEIDGDVPDEMQDAMTRQSIFGPLKES